MRRLLPFIVASSVCGPVADPPAVPVPRAKELGPADASQNPTPREAGIGAAEIVGTELPPWEVGAWHNSEPLTLAQLRGRVVVVRFWTSTCPYCRASMPAIESLAQEFEHEPVTFVGLYHAKPKGRADAWDEAKDAAEAFGVHFPIANDEQWRTLNAWWLRDQAPRATSASFVIGRDGKVVFVHPGPVFFPSDDPAESRQNEDYVAVRAAIRSALDSV